MKAKTAQIYIDGKLILHATQLTYDGKNIQLSGLVLTGTVEKVKIPSESMDLGKALNSDVLKKLEIRLSLF